MLIAILYPDLVKVGIWVNFKFNQDFIAEVLCINKDKPKMACEGTCYLSQQIKKAEEKEESQAPTNKEERVELVYYCKVKLFDLLARSGLEESKISYTYEKEPLTSSFIPEVFRPPELNLM